MTLIYHSESLKRSLNLVIRKMQYSDVKNWLSLFNKSSKYETSRLTLSDAQSYFKSCFNNPDYICVLAEIDKTIVGYRGLLIYSNESQHVAATSGIYILPSYRRMGIATRLMQITENIIKDRGVKIIHGYALAINTPVIRLYKKLGYNTCGKLHKGAKINSTPVDIIILYKELE